jgi:aromatic ring hydroxylase
VPARTGGEFLDDLRGAQRAVWIDGELITDPTTHPTTRGGAASLAELFDRQHKFADECLIPDPETGEAINISHMLPRSLEDLHRRQVGLARMSEGTAGLMGRTPDYMNMKFSAFGSAPWCQISDCLHRPLSSGRCTRWTPSSSVPARPACTARRSRGSAAFACC